MNSISFTIDQADAGNPVRLMNACTFYTPGSHACAHIHAMKTQVRRETEIEVNNKSQIETRLPEQMPYRIANAFDISPTPILQTPVM
jgi:hypothetical protein